MKAFNILSECLLAGRIFLQRSQIQTLRNLSIMPNRTAHATLVNLSTQVEDELRPYALEVLTCWEALCRDPVRRDYLRTILNYWGDAYARERKKFSDIQDSFAADYYTDGTLTSEGRASYIQARCSDLPNG